MQLALTGTGSTGGLDYRFTPRKEKKKAATTIFLQKTLTKNKLSPIFVAQPNDILHFSSFSRIKFGFR